jgi:RNA polymerase sigma factor (sigma-70 family)
MSIPFPTTRRSVIVALSSGDATTRERAFDTLVALYWKPLYKYARVAWHRSREDAEDLAQSFFARALEKETLVSYDAAKAGFRTFLRLVFDRYASNESKAELRLKRGGTSVHLDFDAAEAELGGAALGNDTPEQYFQREWVRSVFALAVERLRAGSEPTDFALFEAYDLDDDRGVSYRELAVRFGLTEVTVTNRLAATRRRFRAIVLDTLREVTASDREYQLEARALLGIDAV